MKTAFRHFFQKKKNKKTSSVWKKPHKLEVLDKTEELSATISTTSGDGNNIDPNSFEARYWLNDEILGKGAFSTVNSGLDSITGNPVAVKIINNHMLLDREREILSNELDLLKSISHPKIVCLQNHFNEIDHLYFVFEKLNGGDLQQRLGKVFQIPEGQARSYIKDVVEALQYLHGKRICHRDIKLENILLQSDGKSSVAKLSDFGFAKHLPEDNDVGLKTKCGTISYIAPEILLGQSYGLSVDLWSLGVVVYSLLSGYQPFRGDGDGDILSLQREILTSPVCFDQEYWTDISSNAKSLIGRLLKKEPAKRLSINQLIEEDWISEDVEYVTEDTHQVFFMIGSQRSGSNWLRTMLDEREDLAGPHPPHIMRDFMPIIDKFGDLSLDENFRILVDHVCTFVENNQVPWTDKHGQERIKFGRKQVYSNAVRSCKRIQSKRDDAEATLENELYLLSIFDAIMEVFTMANGKRTWICKSMGMSKFHDSLLEFYGESRLRYIYLVRDPRDVAMSFMKTPVGDCHYHAIATKWVALQNNALRIVQSHPQILHQVHYEQILQGKTAALSDIYNFIGQRRFGGIKRQASVMTIRPINECLNRSRNGLQTSLARDLSYQFQNLGRGDSFIAEQYQKWKHSEKGLKDEELLVIESVAFDVMIKLGYEPHIVGQDSERARYSKEDLECFASENKQGIQNMMDTLKHENHEDFERRRSQASVLDLDPKLLSDWGDEGSVSCNNPFVSEKLLDKGLESGDIIKGKLPRGRCIEWATASQKGYYPDEPGKQNQDVVCAQSCDDSSGRSHYFLSVFDGHGTAGQECARFASQTFLDLFLGNKDALSQTTSFDAKGQLSATHAATHGKLARHAEIDASRSGTTATSLYFLSDDRILVSNLGDSNCIRGNMTSSGKYKATKMMEEHNLLLETERKRVTRSDPDCFVMTLEEKEGIDRDAVGTNGPTRIWHADPEKSPGVAFTRSLGDTIAHEVGVISQPAIMEHRLDNEKQIFILCTDGVTEWMDDVSCIRIVSRYSDPKEAAESLVKEARKRWLKHSDYVDDISAIVVFVGRR